MTVREIPRSVREVVDHYRKATQIPCAIIDTRQQLLTESVCSICRFEQGEGCPWQERCTALHVDSARMSERFGGSYVYFCQHSLLFWISPVLKDGYMEYAIAAGPVRVVGSDELLEEFPLVEDGAKDELAGEIERILRIDVSQTHSLSEVLRMCAGWASGYAEHRMVESRTSLERQTRFSESIQDLKNQEEQEGGSSLGYYSIQKEEQLQEAIRWGERDAAQEILSGLLGHIFYVSGNTVERVHFRVMELILLLSRAAIQGGASEEDILEISYRCQREIGYYSSLNGILDWLSNILHQYIDMVFAFKDAEYGTVIAQALRYIHQHFQQNITLEETSSAVSLSPNYFSHLFNARMRISFSSYINQLRVEKAAQLLLNSKASLVEIAGEVGFEDQSYFSKVFKNITMLTPGQYRKRPGRFPTDTHEIH